MTGTPPGRQTFAVIDTAALEHNLAQVRRRVAADVRILAVVKADAYGHGARIVGPVLDKAGADAFGVATVGEAVELRNAGVGKPILVLTGVGGRDLAAVHSARLSVAVGSVELVRELAAASKGQRIRVHIKVDTGMARLGATLDELPALIESIAAAGCLDVEGVFSHFGNADDVFTDHCNEQLAVFEDGLQILAAAGLEPPLVHLSNSAASLGRPEAHFNLVRPGIALYGIAPPCIADVELRPVMSLVTHVLQLKEVAAGRPVSYGQTFVTERATRVAVLPIGYADGYGRLLSNRAEVLVNGKRAPVIGTVCMDLTMVDVTEVGEVAMGDEVVLWGEQGGSRIEVGEVGAWQGSIAYEVLNRVGKRVPRVVRR